MRVLGVVAFVGLAVGVLGVAGTDFSEQGVEPQAVERPDLSAGDVADLIDERKFCRLYANALSTGLGNDFAYGNFLRGYQAAEQPDAPPAREVYEELVGRC